MDIQEHAIEHEYFEKLHSRVSRNSEIAVFYEHLFQDTDNFTYHNRAESVDLCLRWWDTDYYRLQAVKDIKRVNLCRDKFCLNCQSMLASKRQLKYKPLLDSFLDDYMIAHCVFTVPNMDGEALPFALDRMYKAFSHFVRYLRGNAASKYVNFLQYGFAGGVRALEVTYNRDEKTFHPHFHCMLLFRKDLDLKRKHINSYSYDHGTLVRKFSDMEILFQKVWYLIYNGEKVNYDAVDRLKEGYSVLIDDSQGHYHEAFKYACKGAFDDEKGGFIYDEQVFRVLYFALKNRRMIQGYGKVRACKDEDGEILEAELEEEYERMIAQLRYWEEPIFKIESFEDILRDRNIRYISKTNLRRILQEEREHE